MEENQHMQQRSSGQKGNQNPYSLPNLEKRRLQIQAAFQSAKSDEERRQLQALFDETEAAIARVKRNRVIMVLGGLFATLLLLWGAAQLFKTKEKPLVTSTKTTSQKSTTTSNDKEEKTPSNSQKIPLVGTWYANLPDGREAIIKISEDGLVRTIINGTETRSKPLPKLEKVADHNYRYNREGNQGMPENDIFGAFSYAQLGGVDVKYDYGIYADGKSIQPVVWSTTLAKEFNYTDTEIVVTGADFTFTKDKPTSAPATTTATTSSTSASSKTYTPTYKSNVNRLDLTTKQVESWAIAAYLVHHGDGRFGPEDYLAESFLNKDDGMVYVLLKENHSSAAMRAAGVDEGQNPTVQQYRINDKGYLEEGPVNWTVIATEYFE